MMKDLIRLLFYFAGVIVLGTFLAPVLFWGSQWLLPHHLLPSLGNFEFDSFFHRALLLAALGLVWPLLRSLRIRKMADLQLQPNSEWPRDLGVGFLLAAIPLLCCGWVLILIGIFSPRLSMSWIGFGRIAVACCVVPIIEEIFFRGLVLGVLERSGGKYLSVIATSALYSIVHFLKEPRQTAVNVTWTSGFDSITHAFSQFTDPLPVVGGFITLFFIGLVLADARLKTRSLWLPIGLHSGWIFANGTFAKLAHHQVIIPPWVGRNLLVGIVPLAIVCLTWGLMRGWLNYGVRKV